MLVPLVLELGQELRVVRRLHLLSNRPQVRSDRVRQALVELVPELVQHHVVRVAVELLEAQPTGVLLVDLVDRVVQRLPGLVGVLLVHLLVVLEGLDDELGAPRVRHAG